MGIVDQIYWGDAQEFMSFLVNCLHQEVNRVIWEQSELDQEDNNGLSDDEVFISYFCG